MKRLLTLLVLFAAAAVAHAQPKFAPGLRAGVNFAKISDTDLEYKTDFYVGGFAGIQFNKVYTLQPEINYSRQGAEGDYEYDNNGTIETAHADISLQYISLGVINKFTFVDRVSIMVGPTFDLLVDNNAETESDVDIAITGGVGCRIAGGLGVEFRIKKGLLNTIGDTAFTDSTGFFEVDQASNLVLQLGLSYTFNIK